MSAADPAPLASLSVTHVYYDPDDTLSLLCAYIALLPQAFCVVYATLALTTREAEIVLTFVGQLLCEALNFLLKRIIKEERPARIHGKGYGMPSSHAQFVAFWSVSMTLFLLVRHTPPRVQGRGGSTHRPWSLLERGMVCGAAFAIAGVTAWSRVYLGYHSVKQVSWGLSAGAVFAVAWFGLVGVVRGSWAWEWTLEHPLVRRMRVRDLIVEEDMAQAGWEKWDDRREAKLAGKKR